MITREKQHIFAQQSSPLREPNKMVCCFAALQYTGCRHRSVFKIDCTRDCEGRCEPQELILEALVCVPCERCLEARADRRILERALIVKRAELLALELQEAQEGGAPCPPHFLYMTTTRVHENLEVASVEFAARLARASYAESWTFEVAELVWQLKHGKCKDVAAVKRKLNQLMKMSTWNLKVISKSSWTRDAVDSSEESNAAATNEDHNVGVTENADTSTDSLATTSISSTADRELMPLPPLSIGTRPSRTNRSSKIAAQVSIAIFVCIAAVIPDADSDRATENEFVRPGADTSASFTGSSKIAAQVSITIFACIAAVIPDTDSDRATENESVRPGADAPACITGSS
ncbi:hypothetical protein BB8028_0005g04660 [Beauveria bassiana]|uniref:Uncharacterized protein n=1 Tax=Beauveria bassiana TaxID=176275 RepID=A0A2S7YFK5_BEABA|nr:hypothetical protein BB8028_0005g04660 [Beauveria bassiana]